jgi:two-component system chemotaxis sensor kinase CheA
LPLTLSKLRCLLFEVAGRRYALPTTHVVRVLRFSKDQLIRVGAQQLVRSGSELVPVVSLSGLLGAPGRELDEHARALVVASLGRSVALTVDGLTDERENIVHKLPPRLAEAPYVSGATLLPGGQVALILHGTELAEAALMQLPRSAAPIFTSDSQLKPRLLVVDDSITTRALIKSILEEAGYEVSAARDGAEAFRMLSEQPFQLVVSDVQMPRMDGFALTEAIRRAAPLARIPVVLVTALETEQDKLRGLEAGANAYLGKSAFDQRVLLDVVGGLL